MAAELARRGGTDNPTVIVVPPPNRGGRYWLEFRAGPSLHCSHRSFQALLWLIFLEAGQEAGRELSDVICATCNPERFRRARSWARALGPPLPSEREVGAIG